jgi:hypothetical protein
MHAPEKGERSYILEDARGEMVAFENGRPLAKATHRSSSATTFSLATAGLPLPPLVGATQNENQNEFEKEKPRNVPTSAAEKETRVDQEELRVEQGGSHEDAIFAALLIACREAGYDTTHESRKELVEKLELVSSGHDFPPDIMAIVVKKTGAKETQAAAMLRPQVHRVLSSMKAAVRIEEERLEEERRIEEERKKKEEALREAKKKKEEEEVRRIEAEVVALQQRREARRREEAKQEQTRERLKSSGICPMGYSFHREGNGWRCNGGSHTHGL